MVPAGNKAKSLSSVNHTTKTIHSSSSSTELPFHNTRNQNEMLDNETPVIPPSRDFHIDKLQGNQNNRSIAHLTVQALM